MTGNVDKKRWGKSTRRAFLWTLGVGPVAWAGAKMLRHVRTRQTPRPVRIAADIPEGLSVEGDIIVSRSADGTVHAYAARCTHLGCRLDRVVGNEIRCPCHGSRFASDGQVVAGPAPRPLDQLRVVSDPKTGGWIAHAG